HSNLHNALIPSLVSRILNSAISMIAGQARLFRMRIWMRRRNHRAMERLGALHRIAIDRGELIFRVVVEGILEALLDLASALRRMLDVPASGSPKGIGRRHRIVVSQPIPDLVQVKELMMGSELKANPSRRICNLGGQAYQLELVVQLACNDLNDLT